MTISRREVEHRSSGGMVAYSLSLARWPAKSPQSLSSGCSPNFKPLISFRRMLSCLHVYLPCSKEMVQPFRMWAVVGLVGQLGWWSCRDGSLHPIFISNALNLGLLVDVRGSPKDE